MLRIPKAHIPSCSELPITPIEQVGVRVTSLTPEEDQRNTKRKKLDACDIAHQVGPEGVFAWFDQLIANDGIKISYRNDSRIVSLKKLKAWYPELRPPVIHGLLRRGETMNIIASPKLGKSMLGLSLAYNVIAGGELFGKFECERGNVLICDNELHCETLVHRNKQVSEALGINSDEIDEMIDYLPLRGALIDLVKLEKELDNIYPGKYSVIILDAFYKLFPHQVDENDNADMANLYNLIDKYADCLEASFILIHHTSKGAQGERSVTDVGSGAGAQSRAADTHLVLRPHENDGVVVIDAAVRSWAPIAPFCARFKYPKWEVDEEADPEAVKGKMTKGQQAAKTKAEQAANDITILEEKLKPAINKPMLSSEIAAIGQSLGLAKWGEFQLTTTIKKWIKDGSLREIVARRGSAGAQYQCTATLPSTPKPQAATITTGDGRVVDSSNPVETQPGASNDDVSDVEEYVDEKPQADQGDTNFQSDDQNNTDVL